MDDHAKAAAQTDHKLEPTSGASCVQISTVHSLSDLEQLSVSSSVK